MVFTKKLNFSFFLVFHFQAQRTPIHVESLARCTHLFRFHFSLFSNRVRSGAMRMRTSSAKCTASCTIDVRVNSTRTHTLILRRSSTDCSLGVRVWCSTSLQNTMESKTRTWAKQQQKQQKHPITIRKIQIKESYDDHSHIGTNPDTFFYFFHFYFFVLRPMPFAVATAQSTIARHFTQSTQKIFFEI